ncbi:MAG: chloride channel protein [Bacteroidales bacterium]|nr:chloride channel protein [Bacteroidales bacterium]
MKQINTKFIFLTILVGVFAGVFGSLFRILLNKAYYVRELMFSHDKPLWFHIIVLAAMWGVAVVVYYLTKIVPLISGSGIPQSKGVIFGRFKFVNPFKQFVSKFIGSVSIIGMGLSLGREGPSVEIGTFGATMISNQFNATPTQRRYLNASGAAAGLSAAFTAPIASTIFLIEDTLGWVSLRVGLTALMACIIAGYISDVMIPFNIYGTIEVHAPNINPLILLLLLIGLGLLGAVLGKFFNYALFNLKRIYKEVHFPVILKILAIILMTYISGMFILDLTSGGEQELIKQIESNNGNTWIIFSLVVIKIIFTAFSYSTGLCGSLLLPLIVIGGLLGKAFALLAVGMDIVGPESCSYFTIIGMSIMFVSVVRAPISGLMLTLEMTGQYMVFFPMIIAGTITFILGQYLRIPPVYDKLYQLMVKEEKANYEDSIVTDFKINEDSYLVGKKLKAVNLPGKTSIVEVVRNGKNVALNEDFQFKRDDLLSLKIKEREYEKLFKVFRTLSNE